MTVIITLDNRNGMRFNHRRQSRDRVLNEYLLRLTEGKTLWMDAESFKLFEGLEGSEHIRVAEAPFAQAGAEDFCFAEKPPVAPLLQKGGTLIVCRWNCVYPASESLDADLSCRHREVLAEFAGSSHEKITVEVYRS